MYGKHHSQEARERISNANWGRYRSEDTRRKMSEAQRRRWAVMRKAKQGENNEQE